MRHSQLRSVTTARRSAGIGCSCRRDGPSLRRAGRVATVADGTRRVNRSGRRISLFAALSLRSAVASRTLRLMSAIATSVVLLHVHAQSRLLLRLPVLRGMVLRGVVLLLLLLLLHCRPRWHGMGCKGQRRECGARRQGNRVQLLAEG